MDIPHLPGQSASRSEPLRRFLPPLEAGAVGELIELEGLGGSLLLDPYGSSPHLINEAARAGCALLVAVNNPITRFALEALLNPFSVEDLQSALASLGATEKDGQRLERFILELYRSECVECGGEIHVEYFVWRASEGVPVAKAYACPHCNHAGQEQASALDRERATGLAGRGLQRAMALEAIAPVGDPDRSGAEAALSVYPSRALFGLITLVNKREQLDLAGRQDEALRALLLAAFDAADNMWAHPEGRPRPKQLTASPEFREVNLWRAMERAIDTWARSDPPVPTKSWSEEGLPSPGEVAVFPGAVREFTATLESGLEASITGVPPRPNQAYWTLSALWTSWLWGRAEAQGIRAALRRRRYDWTWHAEALRQTFGHLVERLPPGTPVFAFVPESEPGYLGACLAGWDAAGMTLEGRSLRMDDRQARLTGRLDSPAESSGFGWDRAQAIVQDAIGVCLRRLGEPARFDTLYMAAVSELGRRRQLGRLWESGDEPPIGGLSRTVQGALGDREAFARLDQRQDIEAGVFWLSRPEEAEEGLADRTEQAVVAGLRRRELWSELELDREVCRQLEGLNTPDRRLVQAALESYAEQDEEGSWHLRSEDRGRARQKDLLQVRELLVEIGERLGYDVSGQDPIQWSAGDTRLAFSVVESATLGREAAPGEDEVVIYVIPGGRASLLAEKARRDPRLKERLEAGQLVLKFRHVRRLASDTTLNRANLMERLALDPPEHQDPQLPLL